MNIIKQTKKVGMLLLICSMVFSPLFIVTTHTATKAHMKELGVPFDLKLNKKVTIKQASVIGHYNSEGKITKYEVKDAKKTGYKQANIVVTIDHTNSLTQKQVQKLADEGGSLGDDFLSIVDYNTGENLELKGNSKKVTWNVDVKILGKKKYKTTEGEYTLYKNQYTLKITYPKTYKGLCLVVGGTTSTEYVEAAYDKGKVPFGQGKDTPDGKDRYYDKKVKNLCHAMRIK